MSYTNETTYYGLPLPTGSDKSTFTDNNTAFQAVDAALHSAYEQSGAATEDIVAIKATVANLMQADINFQNDLNTEKGKIVNLQDKEVLQDTAIAAVKADSQDMITAYNEPTATSSHLYNVGDYFIYNDVLYKATETININDTIVPDTNCVTTNVSTELLEERQTLTISHTGKNVGQLMQALYNAVDRDKLTAKSALKVGPNIFHISAIESANIRFSNVAINANNVRTMTYIATDTVSNNYLQIYDGSTSTYSTYQTEEATNDAVLYY